MFGESKKRAGGGRHPPLVRAVMWRRMPVKMLTMRMMLTRMPTRMMKERNPDKEVCCLASFCCC